MDIALALHLLAPDAAYIGSLTDNTQDSFDNLVWQDSRPKPSWDDIVAAHDTAVPAFNIKQRLAELDVVLPRFDEDVATKLGLAVYGDQAAALSEKQQLRKQLSSLA